MRRLRASAGASSGADATLVQRGGPVRRVECLHCVARLWARALIVAVAMALLVTGRAIAVAEPPTETAWMRCWLDHAGLPPDHVEAAQALLGPIEVTDILAFRASERAAQAAVGGAGRAGMPVSVLLDAEVPLWRAIRGAALPAPGEPLVLTHGVETCLPYPVRSIALSSQPMVRGQTALLRVETDQLAFCHAQYLGQHEPCYREGPSHFAVPIGVSALEAAGVYPLRVEVLSGERSASLNLRMDVAAGRYGFQVINPPASLAGLMDPGLMASEEAHLAQWRSLRSSERRWDLPLAYPLEREVPISADYGDRRSYGGSVSGYHSGVDYRAWTGMAVLAPADGVVVMAEHLEMRGNAVLLDHGWGLVTGYWHLSRIDVEVGDMIERGQPFAAVGNTGLSTGAHLHWEVWANGVSVDGKQWLSAEAFDGLPLAPWRDLVSAIEP
jgi:hypothetical protein